MGWFRKIKRKIRGKRPRIQLTGKNYVIGKRLLLDIVDILNEENIDYMLDSGTLIGLVRDGDILPWDDDVDFTLPERELEKFLAVLDRFKRRGWWISKRYMQQPFKVWKVGDLQSIKIRNKRWLFFRGRVKADLNVKYKLDNEYYWYMLGLHKISKADQKYFDNYEEIEYEGRKVKVPAHYDEFLTLKYGDWRTPNRDYDGNKDDGTTINNNAVSNKT